MVMGGKNAPGLKGFPTPDYPPETSACRTFFIPAREDYLGLLMGAILPLTSHWNYYQWGEMTPEEAASFWYDVVQSVYENAPYATCPTDYLYPTPYWDEASDLDDQAPVAEQVWYGEVVNYEDPADELTFTENASIWAITGFLAVSGEVGAAISFHTIAPSFVLAWRRGDVGEIFRVVVDAADVGYVDTTDYAEGELVEYTVAGEGDDHDLLIVKVA